MPMRSENKHHLKRKLFIFLNAEAGFALSISILSENNLVISYTSQVNASLLKKQKQQYIFVLESKKNTKWINIKIQLWLLKDIFK